jgi:hypothetical protein
MDNISMGDLEAYVDDLHGIERGEEVQEVKAERDEEEVSRLESAIKAGAETLAMDINSLYKMKAERRFYDIIIHIDEILNLLN